MYALNLGEGGRILSACVVLSIGNYDGMPQVGILPEGDISDYRYEGGEYVYDPLPKPEPTEPEPEPEYATYGELAAAIREGVNNYGI